MGAAITISTGMLLTGCASGVGDSESASTPAADAPLADLVPAEWKGQAVKVAVYNDYKPDVFVNEAGDLDGWTVDLAKAAAPLLGLDFEYEPVGFDVVIPGLQSGRYDLALSSLNPLPERREIIDFVSLREGGGSFASAEGSDIVIEEESDLCGLSVAAAQGSSNADDVAAFSENCLAAGEPAIDLRPFPQMSSGIVAVQSGQVDVVTGSTTALLYATSTEGGGLEAQPWSTGFVPQCAGFPQDSDLAEPFAAAIDELIENGTYAEIMQKWGIEDLGTIEQADVLR
jgi:polar amino acid transport system substrate-binding protein